MQPNFINYSALISACSAAGRWQEAERTFLEMLAASETDEECSPNTITFSSLITACERGGRVDRALHWYHQMEERGVEADHIIYRYAQEMCRTCFFLPSHMLEHIAADIMVCKGAQAQLKLCCYCFHARTIHCPRRVLDGGTKGSELMTISHYKRYIWTRWHINLGSSRLSLLLAAH